MITLQGLGVSGGVVVGTALVLQRHALDVDVRFLVTAEEVESELFRLSRARAHALRQIQEIKARIATTAGADHAYLFDAQLLMLDDPMLIDRAAHLIEEQHLNAEWAVQQAGEGLTSLLRQAEDAYVNERHGDIDDVVGRLRLNLRGGRPGASTLLDGVRGPCVLVADDLPPSIAAQIDWNEVVGFATDAGTWTHHTAILARSLGVPAVVGLRDGSARIAPGECVLLDGTRGEVILGAPAETVDERVRATPHRSRDGSTLPAVTADGVSLVFAANVERPVDAVSTKSAGAQGVGLYRSEFLLAQRAVRDLTEDFQTATYRQLLSDMAPAEVTIRTFDISPSDVASVGKAGRDALGLRGLRLSLGSERALFSTQVRSLLRASTAGRLRVLLPFVSSVEELRQARQIIVEAHQQVEAEGMAIGQVPVGIMIEVPSAVAIADLLAREADFFAIGTNDLIQFGLAIDRTDERLAHLYEPLQPAILRMMRTIVRVARRFGRRTSICGEMAADPCSLAVLVGLGLREFSMAPALIPPSAALARGMSAADARQVASHALRLATAREVRTFVGDWLASLRVAPVPKE